MICINYPLFLFQRKERKQSYIEKIGPQPSLNGEVCELLKRYSGSPKSLKECKLVEEAIVKKETERHAKNGTWTPDPSRLGGKRCAQLISVAMANRLEEVWISKQPILLFIYISQYFPSIFRW